MSQSPIIQCGNSSWYTPSTDNSVTFHSPAFIKRLEVVFVLLQDPTNIAIEKTAMIILEYFIMLI
jgi:hypothetical protein